jgi:DNA polymerase III epsilon subunit-like protein
MSKELKSLVKVWIIFFLAAPKFTDVQKDVAALLKDKILIGHSISSDLKVN